MAHILVAEKDRASRRMVMQMLMFHGHTVSGTGNGEQALALCKELRPDLVMVDTNLSGKDGHAVIRDLRCAFKKLRIVALASTGRPVEDCAVRFGADHVLAKPFGIRELLDKVATAA